MATQTVGACVRAPRVREEHVRAPVWRSLAVRVSERGAGVEGCSQAGARHTARISSAEATVGAVQLCPPVSAGSVTLTPASVGCMQNFTQ